MGNQDFHFYTITGNYAPLILELKRLQREGQLLSPRDLVNMDTNTWLELIHEQAGDRIIGFPAETPGKDNVEKARNYVQKLMQAVEETFPTATIAREMERESNPSKADLLRFFTNNPMFEFSRTDIEDYLRENADTALTGIDSKESVINQLKAMQRVYNVTPRYGEMSTLLSEGMSSAQDIASMDESAFVQKFGKPLGESRAREIYQNATQTEISINEEVLNLSIRQFLKFVGVSSQRKIEQAVTNAIEDGRIKSTEILAARMTLEIKELNLTATFTGEIRLQ